MNSIKSTILRLFSGRKLLYHRIPITQYHKYQNNLVNFAKINNYCLGNHNYYDVPKMQLSNCTKNVPSFLLFNNNGELHGFGQTTVGNLSSLSFEHPNRFAVKVCI